MTALKFTGSIHDLRQLLLKNHLIGCWENQPYGVFMWRSSDGGNLHWASTNKSLWFSGKPVCRDPLIAQIRRIIWSDALQRQVMNDDDDVDLDID